MPRSLIVPGVSISTDFDVAPPLPARSGILGAVGVVDGAGSRDVQSVTTRQEVLALFGPATLYSFPEVFRALANGVSEVVLSPVAPTSGQPATCLLVGDAGDPVVELRARAVGPWGNRLSVRVTRRLGPDGTVRNLRMQVLLDGAVLETHDGLVLRDGDDQDLFTAINRDSRSLTALDPVYEADLPARDSDRVAFVDSPATAAAGALRKGGAALVNVAAKSAGQAGNLISLQVTDGHALSVFNDGATPALPALRVIARNPGPTGKTLQVEIVANVPAAGVDVRVTGFGGVRSYTALTGINRVIDALNGDPDVRAERPANGSNALPAPIARGPLAESRNVTVRVESVRTKVYADLSSADAIAAALNSDGALTATVVGTPAAGDLPDVAGGSPSANDFYLNGGRDAGPARDYKGQNNPDAVILDLVPAPNSDAARTRFQVVAGSRPNTVRILAGVADPSTGFLQQEAFDNLTMDPDSDHFLVDVLASSSALLRAVEHIQRSHATHFPVESTAPTPLAGGAAPLVDAYQTAIDALADEEDVDLLLAGIQDWADPTLDGVAVQRALLGHARTQSDNARPRIALGSIRPSENPNVKAILDHAAQVADRRFVLCAPSGTEGAVAGLLGHLDYFQSPTFKTVADPGVQLIAYSDADLDHLVGPDGNLCVVRSRRGRGTIVLKGIATDGFQISVLRVADHCVREVKAICDRFIGELNNADSRNALKQMILADFTQLERDGAIVPSVDGKSPAFVVDVYASQNDAAGGIVRVDIAVRPVRAIDYVYATIHVKN
jgi:hypothetical protein